MTNHFVLPLSVLRGVRCFHIILGVGAWHSPTSHQNNYISYISNVRNGPQGMIHHSFLGNKKTNISSCFNYVLIAYLVLSKHTDTLRPGLSKVCNTSHAWRETPIETKSFTFQKLNREKVSQWFISVEKHIKTTTAEPAYAGHVCVEDYEQIIAAKRFGLLWAQSILDVAWLRRCKLTLIIWSTNSNYFYSQIHQSNCLYDMALDHGFLIRREYKSQHILKTNFNI